jgi:hypothetical protein
MIHWSCIKETYVQISLGEHRLWTFQLKLVLDHHFLINFIPTRTSIGIIWFEKKIDTNFQGPNIKVPKAQY